MTSRLARRVAVLCAAAAGLCALPAAAAPPLPDTPIILAVRGPNDTGTIHAVRPDGTQLTQLPVASAPFLFYNPGVNPDADSLAYGRPNATGLAWDLITAKLDGSGERVLLENPGGVIEGVRWSPDGEWIAFRGEVRPGYQSGNGFGLFVVRSDGTSLRRLDTTDTANGFSWTSDGRSLLFVGSAGPGEPLPNGCEIASRVHVFAYVDALSAQQTLLDPCEPTRMGLWGFGNSDVAPDGRLAYITYVGRFDPGVGEIETRRLWVSSPDGGQPQQLHVSESDHDDWWIDRLPQTPVQFSPDGNWLLVKREGSGSPRPHNLVLMPVDGGAVVPIDTGELDIWSGQWAPSLALGTTSDDADSDGTPDTSDNCPTTANPGQEDTDGDGAGDLCDTDLDNDGIDNAIDTGLDTFADDNAPVITEGTIVDRAGLDVTVSDAAAPEGVRIVVGSGTGKARFQVCQGFTIRVAAGSEVVVTCGSVKLGVVDGEAEIVLGDASTIVTVPEGGTAKVDTTGTDTYTLQNTGTVPVSITVDGTTASVPAGTTAPVATWNFTGFAAPVDNPPVVNLVKAGRAIPLKWRVTRSDGTPVTNLTTAAITTVRISCSTGATTDEVEETTAGGSGLLNQGNGNYQLNWKSQTTHAGTCRELRLDIGDGIRHTALFRFN